jgi:hypothetical protein
MSPYAEKNLFQPAILPKVFMAGNRMTLSARRSNGWSEDDLADYIYDKYFDNIVG